MSNHIEIHRTSFDFVDPFPGLADDAEVFVNCGRCGGVGYIAGMEHVENAMCFGCRGLKGHTSTAGAERKTEKGRLSYRKGEETKLLKKQRFHNEQMEKAEAAFPILAGWCDAMSTNSFLLDIWTKAFDYELSEKQIAAAAKVLQADADRTAARAAEKAELNPVVEGKGSIQGEIITVKYQDSQYGGAWKMLVKDDRNFKVWGSIPAAIFTQQEAEVEEGVNPAVEALVGRKVSFNASAVEASDDDKTFGFFSRPTKAILHQA